MILRILASGVKFGTQEADKWFGMFNIIRFACELHQLESGAAFRIQTDSRMGHDGHA